MGHRRILLIFAKAPVPGRVKTRLAEELGEHGAAEYYRVLGGGVLDRLRGGDYRAVIYHDPPDAASAMHAWLGAEDGIEFLPQPGGGLGERLDGAFAWGFGRGELVCVVGTDIPELGRAEVEGAFARLEDPEGPDAVFGPALDGGYYLLALRRPAPSLFGLRAWSTGSVLEESLSRAEELGLRVDLLRPLADIDRPEDLPEELRPPSGPATAGGSDRDAPNVRSSGRGRNGDT